MRKLIGLLVLASLASCGKKKSAPATETATPEPSTPTPLDHEIGELDGTEAALAKQIAPDKSALPSLIEKSIDAMDATLRAASHEGWDPAAVVASVGKERVALFNWVRDHTALVPYRGSLRGAVGVMMDRVGNSLDRSLLLAELLTQSGLEVRLANATIDDPAVAKLAASVTSRARPPIPRSSIDGKVALSQLMADAKVDAAAFKASFAKVEAARGALAKQVAARVQEQSAALAKLVPGTAPAIDTSSLADHWWVQVHDGDAWTDLDPALPDAAPGNAFTTPTETPAPGDLADDRRHTLTVRVIGEVWHGDAREEAVLLEHTFAPAQFYGQRIQITNLAIDMPPSETLEAAKDPASVLQGALIAQTEWLPYLRVGSAIVAKMTVTDGGELFDAMDANGNSTRLGRAVQRATKAGVGGATGMLDTLPGGSDEAPAPAKPAVAEHSGFTAEWIEYELRAPGGASHVERRIVFDSFGVKGDRAGVKPIKLDDAKRLDRGLALVGETELLPMFARIPPLFVADRIVKGLVALEPKLVAYAKAAGTPQAKALRAQLTNVEPLPDQLYTLAMARFDWSGPGEQVFLDGLDLLAQRRQIIALSPNLQTRVGFDIIANHVAVWPTKGADPRAIRIQQGVADTVAESAVSQCAGQHGCTRSDNASDQFAAAGNHGWSISPPAVAVLAEADAAAHYTIVAAPTAPTTWWRIDPSTGETLGMSRRGGGVSAETAMTMNVIAYSFTISICLISFGTSVRNAFVCGVGATLGFVAISLPVLFATMADVEFAAFGMGLFATSLGALPPDP